MPPGARCRRFAIQTELSTTITAEIGEVDACGVLRGLTGTASYMNVLRTIALFVVAAVAEIGGAWLIWQGAREHRGVAWIGAGIVALAGYGFVATLQEDSNFGRILAAYGGIFVAGSLAWGIVMDGFKPDRFDYLGAGICLVGVAVIMFAPRG